MNRSRSFAALFDKLISRKERQNTKVPFLTEHTSNLTCAEPNN